MKIVISIISGLPLIDISHIIIGQGLGKILECVKLNRTLSKNLTTDMTRVFRYVLHILKSIGKTRYFAIKRGYIHRREERFYDDTGNKDEYQKEVYEKAREIMINDNLQSVIDFGCGSGYKLLKFLAEFRIIGIERGATYRYLMDKYPSRKWYNLDDGFKTDFDADLVICADVIEHLINPDILVEQIMSIKCRKIIISTPERVLRRGRMDFGPPANPYHIREWNQKEFSNYIGQYFEIIDHYISNLDQCTQVIICRPYK